MKKTESCRNKFILTVLYSFFLFFCTSFSVFASKAYITDEFRISLRRGPTIENKILRFLPSGSPVEILQNTDEGWSEVKTLSPDEKQITGWVLSRYLVHRLPYETQASSLKEDNIILKEQIFKNNQVLKANNQKIKELSEDLKKTKSLLAQSEKAYLELKNNSADFFQLQSELNDLHARYDKILREKSDISQQRTHQWMGVGALILIGGYIFGFLGGKKNKKLKTRGYL